MGTVYAAVRDDDQFRQQVALKLVKRGMDTQFVLRRFRHERQILASLEHPHIARLLDGGTTPDGLPYFVMEHITGHAITNYCETHHLSIPETTKTLAASLRSSSVRASEADHSPRPQALEYSGDRPTARSGCSTLVSQSYSLRTTPPKPWPKQRPGYS